MPLNATKILIEDSEKYIQPQVKQRFSFDWFAKKIIERQKSGKDTNILVVGERRNGKSNWALKLVRAFIKLKKKEDPGFTWSWEKNFARTRADALEMIPSLPEGSFDISDEGGDIAYRGDTVKVRQKQLIKLMIKSGDKLLLSIIVTSDYFVLDPKIVNMCLFLVAVPYRYKNVCAFAFIYGRNPNPFIYDKFGIERIRSMFTRKKAPIKSQIPNMEIMKIKRGKKILEVPYPRELFKFLKSIPTFLYLQRFSRVDKNFEERYIKNVKEKQRTAHLEGEDEFINLSEYKKLEHQYRTLLYNLKVRQGLSVTQIERLHIDPATGVYLRTRDSIRRVLDSASAVHGDRFNKKKNDHSNDSHLEN